MQIGESISVDIIADPNFECPFPHDLEEPPEITNDLEGKGGTLKSKMSKGESTYLYAEYAPDKPVKWPKVPQEDSKHAFYNKKKAVEIHFKNSDGTYAGSKSYPVSCSAHHLVPSQESLKGHKLLQYMCKKDTSEAHNHSYSKGVVWSDVGYDTNGTENGVYLPGNYAVGGGHGLGVWYPNEDHDEEHIEVESLPKEDYAGWLLTGRAKGRIDPESAAWHYVAKAMMATPGQFHDRHLPYSNFVKKGLEALNKKCKTFDVTLPKGECSECKKRADKIEDQGLPAPYSIVQKLEAMSNSLRRYLTAQPESWKENVFTSEWCENYMKAIKAGGEAKEAAEQFDGALVPFDNPFED